METCSSDRFYFLSAGERAERGVYERFEEGRRGQEVWFFFPNKCSFDTYSCTCVSFALFQEILRIPDVQGSLRIKIKNACPGGKRPARAVHIAKEQKVAS